MSHLESRSAVVPGPSRRAVLGLGGAAAVSGALAACSGRADPPGADAASPVSGTSASTPARPEVRQWYHEYGEAGVRQAVEGYAADYPDAAVTVGWRTGEYDRATAAALARGSGPDVFEYPNGPTIDMITQGHVVDLRDVLGSEVDDFQQSIIGRMSHDGAVWAIPQAVDVQLLVYRRSLLERARVTPPTTMAELLVAAEKLTRGGRKGLFLGNDGGVGIMGGPTLWGAGLDYLTDDDKFGFDDPRAVQAFGRLRELWEADVLLLGAPKDWSDPTALLSGATAIQFTGLWTFPDLVKGLGTDIGVLPWPALDEMGNPSVPVGAYGSCVSARATDVGAAKAFVKWLWVDRDDAQLEFATAYGFHIPARTRLIEPARSLRSGPAAAAAQISIEHGVAQSRMLWTPACAAAFATLLDRVVRHGADAAAEIAKVRTVVDAELQRVHT